MVAYIKKYKYLIFSTFSRLYLLMIFHNEYDYVHCLYQLDFHFFNLIVGLGITILDILYIVHYVLKTYDLKEQIIIRVHQKGYLFFVLENTCLYLVTFLSTQILLQTIIYQHLTYHVFIYSFVLMITNFIIFKFHHDSLFQYLVILSLLINTFIKIFY